MTLRWILCLVLLALALASLLSFQRASSPARLVVTGAAALVSVLLAILLLATLVF